MRDTSVPAQPTWKPGRFIVLAVMLIGVALAIAWPFWLAPPQFQQTAFVYIGLTLLWIPVALVCVIVRAKDFTIGSTIAMILVGVVLVIFVFGADGPRLSTWGFEPADCQPGAPAGDQVTYVCKHAFGFGVASGYDQFTLQGAAGSSLVRLVDHQQVDNP